MAERNPARNIDRLRQEKGEEQVADLTGVTQNTPLSDERYQKGFSMANLLGTTFGDWPSTHGYLHTTKDGDYGSQSYVKANQDDPGTSNRIWSPLGGLSNLDITTLVNTGIGIDVGGGWPLNDGQVNDPYISPDGTMLFVIYKSSNYIVRFDLATPYNLSGVVTQATETYRFSDDGYSDITGLTFSVDGTKMYLLMDFHASTPEVIIEYDLVTPWQLDTATIVTTKSIATHTSQPFSLTLSPDGHRMYVASYGTFEVFQFNLLTPWDVSSLVLGASGVYSPEPNADRPKALALKSDGAQIIIAYINNTDSYRLHMWNMATPWELSTTVYAGKSTSGTANNPSGLCISSNSTYLYKTSQDSDEVRMYTLDPPIGVASWTEWEEVKSSEEITQETNDAIATHVSTIDHLARIRTVYVDDAGGNVEFDTGTTFTDISEVDVFLNGLRILAGTEFIASTTGGNENSHIELTAATVALDDLEIITWKVQ